MQFFLLVFIFFSLIFDRLNIFLYLLISAILHEAGHISACLLCGHRPKVKASLFGICLANYPAQRAKKLMVVLCGPLVNLLLFAVSHCMLQHKFSLGLYVFGCVNLLIFAFNMLPVNFLDGGVLLQLVLGENKAAMLTDIFSFLVMVSFAVLFSDSIIHSAFAILLFAIYYCINKINLRL